MKDEWMNERTNKHTKKQSEQINVQITTWDKQPTVQREKIDEKNKSNKKLQTNEQVYEQMN